MQCDWPLVKKNLTSVNTVIVMSDIDLSRLALRMALVKNIENVI